MVIVAALLIFLYFTYAVDAGAPFWTLSPADNVHLTVLGLFLGRLSYVIGAAVIVFASLCAGLFILNRIGFSSLLRSEKAAFAVGLGLGVFSLTTLGLGVAGLLLPQAFGPLVIVVAGIGIVRGIKFVSRLRNPGEPWSPLDRTFAALAALGALVTLVYAFMPPVYFDGLEYHLGAAAQHYRAGRISYIAHNVYSNFPSNGEMLYLLSMVLTGGKLSGAILGNVINASISVFACIAVYALGNYLSGPRAGTFAAAALATSAGFFAVTTGVYVEPLQTLYTVLAVLAMCRFQQERSTAALVASALVTGLAMGVKYPSAIFVAVPLAAASLLASGPVLQRVKSFALFTVISMLVVSPWLVKNAVLTGNPVYPLLYDVFGGRDWSPIEDARWSLAHTPKGGLAPEQWARHFFALFFSNENISLLSFVFAPLAFVKRPRARRTVFALGFALLYVFLWFALTHRVDRFALPAFAVLGAVSGAGLAELPQGWTRRLSAALTIFLLFSGIFYMAAAYGHVLKMDLSVPLFGKYDEFLRDNKEGYPAWTKLNESVPDSAKVLLVGEAETFYIDAHFAATTVFDRKPLDEMIEASKGDPADLARRVKDAGFDYLFVNWATLRRQGESYAFEYEGRKEPGYSARTTPQLFDALVSAGRAQVVFSAGPNAYPNVPAYVLYLVK
jgi:hypothetical protein